MARLVAGRRRIWCSVPGRDKILSFKVSRTILEPKLCIQWVHETLFLGVNCLGRKGDLSIVSIFEVKMYECIPTLPYCVVLN